MWARGSEGGARGLSGTEAALAAMRARSTPLGAFRATLLSARGAAQLKDAYRAAEPKALASDPCLNPEFLSAAARHDPALRDLAILALWKGDELCAMTPVLPGGSFIGRRVWRAPRVDAVSAGAPFIVRDQAEEALAATLDWFADRGAELVFGDVDADSPFRNVLERVCSRSGRIARFASLETARPAPLRDEAVANPTGAVFERASEPAELRAAVETHLLLESREAAFAGRPALIQQAGAANLLRAVTRQFARFERCRVFTLRDAAGPLAVAIVLSDGEKSTLWRISADPGRGGERAKSLLASRVSRALERGRGGPLAGLGGGIRARASVRIETRLAQGPATIARRLGERLRSAATVFSRAA